MNTTIPTVTTNDSKWFKYLVYTAQTFFGAWFLIHGLNHWFHFFYQPSGSDSMTAVLLSALMKSGLFTWIKAAEVVSGIMLLTHRFVPFGFVLAVPAALVIVYINMFLNHDLGSRFVALTILAILTIIGLGYLDSFKGMLRYNQGEPSGKGLQEFFGDK